MNKIHPLDINSLIARLEKVELSEELKDDHFKNVVWPMLTSKDIMKKFGTLSQQQQDEMMQNAFQTVEATNSTKWTQTFFNTCLSQDVRLSTFLSSKQPIKQSTTETAYSNYKYLSVLNEDDISVTAGSRTGDILYLKDPMEIRAYVRSANPAIYISSTVSGKYKQYITASNNPPSAEGKQLKNFAVSLVNSVKTAAINDLANIFSSPEEKAILEGLKKSNTVYAVLLDAISLALVDILNQGTYSRGYGPTTKAGIALLSNNLLSEQPVGYKSLLQTNPAAAQDISTKLQKCIDQRNPYITDIRLLNTAFIKARSSQNIYSGVINRFTSAYSDLVSSIGKSLGNTKINFDELIVTPQDQKADLLLSLVSDRTIYNTTTTGSEYLRNPFIRVVSKKMSGGNFSGYAILSDLPHGIVFNTNELGDLVPSEYSSKDIKAAFLPYDVHEHIVNETLKHYNTVSGPLYAREFEQLETKSDTQANAPQGDTRSTKAQLLNVLQYLFDSESRQMRTDTVLLAIVPKVLCQGATFTKLLVTDSAIQKHTGYTLESILRNATPELREPATEILASLRPIKDVYYEYINILLDYNTSVAQIAEVKNKFITLAQNLHKGIWSSEGLTGFGVFNGLDDAIRLELRINDNILNNDIESTKKIAMINARKAEEASNT